MKALDEIKKALRRLGSPRKAKGSASFFKTGKGQYGEGDVFLGVTVPEQRAVAKGYLHLPLRDVLGLLRSAEHEFRLTALLILVARFRKGAPAQRAETLKAYLAHTRWVNNWDLVDASAAEIVGESLSEGDISLLLKLARSPSLWERRIAMVATFAFIRKGRPAAALRVAEVLLSDENDLIHKAVGWMLREVGKRCSRAAEAKFLDKHHRRMPRTALRYALEHFPQQLRSLYMKR
jgi:3-methyladenine DNA glycosylase AlkD